MTECKHNYDEICTNPGCPLVADYCPVPDTPDVCKYSKTKARWKGAGLGDYTCSLCSETYSGGDEFKFCPNCGAYMGGD